jgi:alcohol dehydrogenase (cytochrome c)
MVRRTVGLTLSVPVVVFLAGASVPASAQARPVGQTGPVGTWRAESAPPGATWTAVLRLDGSRVIGAARNCGAPRVEISDGHADGNTITFSCENQVAKYTIALTGTVSGDVMAFEWELHVQDGGVPPSSSHAMWGVSAPRRFTARRVPDAVDTVLVEMADRIRRTPAVSFERILDSRREPQNWLTYSGTLSGHRHSPLTQITPTNVKDLELAWIWQAQSTATFEATALVVDGVLYTVQAPNDVVALDAVTGRVLWTFPYSPPARARAGGGDRPNRGLAILGGTLFMGTLDAHLVAIDALTGKLRWNTTVANADDPACQGRLCYVITHAPLVVKNAVIVGVAGGEGRIRGFIAAFDVTTGKELWRFYTIPAAGEPGNETWAGDSWKTGGGGIWNTGAYDADLNLTYWGTGNPAPPNDVSGRSGDNLYSNSVVALDADTGRLKWHYQFTPHDDMDWDAAQIPVLTDLQWQGRSRKVMLWANRNGLLYVLDRITGEFLRGTPFVEVDWMKGFDPKGRPIRVPGKVVNPKSTYAPGTSPYLPRSVERGDPALRVMPGVATNWYPPSYSQRTGLFYVPAWERGTEYGVPLIGAGGYGAVRAFDPITGDRKWEFKLNDAIFSGGVLTTTSDLLFTGVSGDFYSASGLTFGVPRLTPDPARLVDGYFYALDARTGEVLWRMSLAASVRSGPMSYAVDGKQYVTVAAGNTLFAFALRQ